MKPRIHIDTDFLLRQVAGLVQVKRKRRTWGEFGDKVVREYHGQASRVQPGRNGIEAEVVTESSEWGLAKELVHAVMANRDPRHDAIRKRLGNLQEPSTPRLLSTLSLWLAGVLGISTSATGPMVAAMLYAVGVADGDWEVLGNPKKC